MKARRQSRWDILRSGRISVRDFPAHVVADIDIAAHGSETGPDVYLILIAYFSGSNMSQRPVPLLGPVEQVDDDDWILTERLLPALVQVDNTIRFNVSECSSADRFPEPTDARMTLRTVAAARFASIWFLGQTSPERITRLTTRLETFIALKGLTPATSGDRSAVRTTKSGPFDVVTELSMQLSEWPASSQLGFDRTKRRQNGRARTSVPSGRQDGKAYQLRQ